ncbi:nickel transporter [Candidatus Methylomirabilis sp.]|uniref:nickel transporter n=1 Tax=Candidatus Methylomirabilis sp. TaxID=2032687 RepID=UPI003C739656
MSSLFGFAVGIGLVSGLMHALSGPDHLAALAPMAVNEPRLRWRLGLRWGLGHALGTWAIALVALTVRDRLALEGLSNSAERLIGVVLVATGIWGLWRALRARIHSHSHRHGEVSHAHFHAHAERMVGGQGEHSAHRHVSTVIGVLHGLAGSGTFLAAVFALAFPTAAAIIFAVAYGVGAMLGMGGFTWLLGEVGSRFYGAPASWLHPALLGSCALFSIVVGGFWMVA